MKMNWKFFDFSPPYPTIKWLINGTIYNNFNNSNEKEMNFKNCIKQNKNKVLLLSIELWVLICQLSSKLWSMK